MSKIYESLEKNYIKLRGEKIIVYIDREKEPWFLGKDVMSMLGYKNPVDKIKLISKINKKKLGKIELEYESELHKNSIFLSEKGLYEAIMGCRFKNIFVEKFKKWIINDVLPAIRKYGIYKISKEKDLEINKINEQLIYTTKKYEEIKNELKKDKYPKGCVFYVVDYSTEEEEIYRIGITCDIEQRLRLYETHSLFKKKAVIVIEHKCPIKFEKCMQSSLYDYRLKNNKDFYKCNLSVIKKMTELCITHLLCVDQLGGTGLEQLIDNLNEKKNKLQNEVKNLNKKLLKETKKYI